MVDAAVIAIFIEGPHFEVAVNRQPKVAFERFENNATGVKKLARWLVDVLPKSAEKLHSCVAVSSTAPKSAYESAVFEFAYDNTQNTFIWNPAQVASLPAAGEGNTASRMLPACVSQHERPR